MFLTLITALSGQKSACFTDLKSAKCLIQSDRSNSADDDSFSVPTQGVLQDAGQLTVSVVGEAPENDVSQVSTMNSSCPVNNCHPLISSLHVNMNGLLLNNAKYFV